MSETELVNPSLSQLSTNRAARPILKTNSQKPSITRLDWAGNEIMKGGQHKIAFAIPRSDEENISNSFEELGEEIEQEYYEMVDYRKKSIKGKFQPDQSNQSVCCCIY